MNSLPSQYPTFTNSFTHSFIILSGSVLDTGDTKVNKGIVPNLMELTV